MKKMTFLKKLFLILVCWVVLPKLLWAEENTCPTFMEYRSGGTGDNFLLNPTFEILVKALASVAETSWNEFATPLQGVVMIGAAIYIAVYSLKNIGSFSKQDVSAYLSNEKTGVIPLMVKVAAVLILLTPQGNSFMYGNFISPVVSACMRVGAMFGNSPVGSSFGDAYSVRALFSNILETVKAFNEVSYEIVALGQELLCLTFMPDSFIDKFWGLLPFGLILFIFGWLICIGLAFYMLDVLFRLGVGCIVLPFAIACAVSKLTSTYSQKTWGLFVNVCFNFMVIGIIADFSIKMLGRAISGHGDIQQKLTSNAVLQESEVEQLYDKISTVGFIITFICCLIVFKLFTEIEDMAQKISGAKAVGQAAQKASSRVAKLTSDGAKKLGKGIGKSVIHKAANTKLGVMVRTGANNIKNGAKNGVKKMFGL